MPTEGLRIYSPVPPTAPDVGAVVPTPIAPLAGRRVAVLDNGKAGADVLLGALAEALGERTGAEPVGLFRKGSAATPCEPDLVDRLAREAELVLTGTAD